MTGRREEELSRPFEPMRQPGVTDSLEFLDDGGVRWRVTERDARDDPGARGDRCLIFTCAEAVRRVWGYPADWRNLPREALIALSWER